MDFFYNFVNTYNKKNLPLQPNSENMDLVKKLESTIINTEMPDFAAGDNVTVHYKIKEGNKERIQPFQGTVLQRRGSGAIENFYSS